MKYYVRGIRREVCAYNCERICDGFPTFANGLGGVIITFTVTPIDTITAWARHNDMPSGPTVMDVLRHITRAIVGRCSDVISTAIGHQGRICHDTARNHRHSAV